MMSELPAVGIHRRHDVDACGVEELADVDVAIVVLITQVVGQLEQQFSTDSLITVHVGDILELRLPCNEKYSMKYSMLDIITCTLIEKGLI